MRTRDHRLQGLTDSAAEYAFHHDYGVQVSERSGETEDPIISDLVVALNSGQIKPACRCGTKEQQSTTACSRMKKSLVLKEYIRAEISQV
jgi:enolase